MKIRNILIGASFLLTLFLTPSAGVQAVDRQTSVPPNITFETVATGLTQPVLVTNAGDGTGRIFIVQQTGQILIMKGTTINSTPFLDVSSLIDCCGEQGLLGLAFDPHYSTNGYFYILFTNTSNVGDDVLYRYHVSSSADVADPASGQLLLTITEPEVNHNGGDINFGQDGFLYIGIGDGGGGGDNHGPIGNGQNKNTLLGKMLRINVDLTFPYTIPADNPFAGGGGSPEIWAYGLRNPWRWSFDKSTGDLYIGDVGQDTEEEVDFQAAGAAGGQNYGWRIREGNLCYNPSSGCVNPPSYVPPITTYDHGAGDATGCAIVGGYVYRGTAYPAMQGVYFFGDYCSGRVWAMYKSGSVWVKRQVAKLGINISSFGQDEAGELYICDLGGNILHIKLAPISTASFSSEAPMDGFVIEKGKNTGVGAYTSSSGTTLLVGDNNMDQQIRSIVSFNTATLPDTAVITSAVLSLTKLSVTGGDPFASLGSLVADVGMPVFGNDGYLGPNDFQATAGFTAGATFSSPPVSGVYSASLLAGSWPQISTVRRTQFRLRFTTPNNNNQAPDRINFYSGDTALSANMPQLVLQYYVP